MNEKSWAGEGSEAPDEDVLFELLREDIGRPPAASVDRAVTAVQQHLRQVGTRPDEPAD